MAHTFRVSGRSFSDLSRRVDYSWVDLRTHLAHQGVGVGSGEVRSWRNSLPVLARDLQDAGLSNVEVLLEHKLPLSSKRTDAILAGVDPRTGRPSYLVVELKQWTQVRPSETEELVEVVGARYKHSLHPSRQVRGYVDYLRDFTLAIPANDAHIDGVAYLHNADVEGVSPLFDAESMLAEAPVFTRDQRGKWLTFLRNHFSDESGANAADLLLASKIGPSKQLLAHAAAEIREREQFQLLDEQEVAYRIVLKKVRTATRANTKTAVVVSGGPGSGKSVIALALLGELARQGRSVLHATGSQSFTQTLRRVAGHRSTATKGLFKYFNQFMEAEQNGLDALILDEAHRLRETSVDRYTPKQIRDTRGPQVDELLNAARVPVFLLDEHQVVRPGETGTVRIIEAAAQRLGMDVIQVDLNGQFRAGGSAAYIDWVLHLLGLRADAEPGDEVDATLGPSAWVGDQDYSLAVVDTPEELESALTERLATGDSARMTAGYCWPWSNPTPDGHLVPDVQIGTWARPWNLKSARRIADAPPSHLWATEEGGFGQVGCVYTAQGFEYDWNGLIIGPDLVRRGDRWIAQRQESRDPAFRRMADPADFDRLIRNIYKVLLTRGMKGTVIYSTDLETRDFLKSLITA